MRARGSARSGHLALLGATLVALAVSLTGIANAHAFLVLGEMNVEPDPPRPGEPLTFTIEMADPSLAPVEDAVVFIEVRRAQRVTEELPDASTEDPELPPADATIDLVELSPGRYVGELVAPAAGTHHLLVRDQTFEWEEANASVMMEVAGAPLGTMPFILPPTAVGPRSLWVWLLWLVGLPLLAGLVVTALVLGSRKGPEEAVGS